MSLSILLLNNGDDSVSIKDLIKSKIPNYTISFQTIEDSKNSSNRAISKSFNSIYYDLCIVNERKFEKRLTQLGGSIIKWDHIKDLSAKLDVFLQLHRYVKKYPLSLKGWKLTKVLHDSQDCIIYKAIGHKSKQSDTTISAIKRFKFKPTQLSRESIDEYLEDISLQCGIRSNGLVHIYEGGISDNAFYLLMEFLPFGNLRQFLNSIDEALPLKHALEWFEEIANALAVVHQAGLIHRDLKIDNIMLREDGSLALTDYGVSKNILLNAGFLFEDEIHGSPYYVSPELISGELCSQSSDIYSLGVIFYELLTGARPYDAKSTQDLMMAHIMEPIPILPDGLSLYQTCLDKMMAKSPDNRFKNMTELLKSFKFCYEVHDGSNIIKMTPPHL